MKKVQMMILEDCPYCRQAFTIMEHLKQENPEFSQVEITITDEAKDPEFANSLDYYYVPTFFVDGQKIHEGIPTESNIKKVYEAALA